MTQHLSVLSVKPHHGRPVGKMRCALVSRICLSCEADFLREEYDHQEVVSAVV
jgi:hypothetical protein